jgi:hypothetical protein
MNWHQQTCGIHCLVTIRELDLEIEDFHGQIISFMINVLVWRLSYRILLNTGNHAESKCARDMNWKRLPLKH